MREMLHRFPAEALMSQHEFRVRYDYARYTPNVPITLSSTIERFCEAHP